MRLRIDEVAQRTGITARNIRAYQARGLIPAPALEGRTGYYGEEHLQRLELISELQDRGFSLEAIRQVLDTWSRGGNLAHLLGLRNLLDAPFAEEEPETASLPELLDRFPEARTQPQLVTRAIELDILRPRSDGDVDVPNPMLLDAGEELTRIGVPLDDVLRLVEDLRSDTRRIADRFISLVVRSLGEMFVAGELAARAEDVTNTLERLRPLAVEVLRPFLARALQEAIEDAQRDVAAAFDGGAPARGGVDEP